MIFYLVLGGLFSVYGLDLLLLVIVSIIARAQEEALPVFDKERAKKVYLADGGKTVAEGFPKVLVQVPMYNEDAHCEAIIRKCCAIQWPRERLLIQVLDDSTREEVRDKVDAAAAALAEQGHPVQVLRRDNRAGYKAGALVEGLKHVEAEGYEFVALFDADFEPPADFLYQTIHYLQRDDALAFVQTRWRYTNVHTFLTWAQRVNLDFHFDVEQRARSFMGWFFNFNGTAGVWRIAAIADAGGWESDTVVEDMDLSLRAYLRGWRTLYLPQVENPNELPVTLSSYRTQQHRWLAGPMQILVKSISLIFRTRGQGFWRRANALWFFSRYVLFAAVTLGVLAVPPVALWLDPWVWAWPEIFFLCAINFALLVYLYMTPFSLPYLLFSVAVGYFKAWAMLSGLLGLKKSKTWKVTAKWGGNGTRGRIIHRPYLLESLLAMYYATLGGLGGWMRDWFMLGYCSVMTAVFVTIAFGDSYM